MAAAIAVAAVLLVVATIILSYPGKSGTTSNEPTTTATSQERSVAALSTSDYNSSLGLELTMSIARTTLSENDGVSMYLSLDNTLATQNNLTRPAGRNLPSSSYETCSQLPVGGAIFQGNYDVANASQGEPLGLIGPNEENVNGCAGFPNSWSLAPMSNDLISYRGPAAANLTYWGYWTYQGGEVFRPFSPGIYTVEGEDFWGQATILHFQVVENQNPLDCATIASNSSFVGYANGSAGAGPLMLDAYYRNPGVNNTVVLALTNTGNSTVTTYDTASLGFLYTPYIFSPDGNLVQRWHYYAPNGTLGYPAIFYPNQCVLISITFSLPFPQFPLTMGFADNRTQTFTFNP